MTLLSSSDMHTDKNNRATFEFKNLQQQQITLVNDGVMGGRSSSELNLTMDFASYIGMLSLENNGGFASVRMIWPFALTSFNDEPTVAVLKVKGDGLIYQFRLRTNQGIDGAAFSYSFKTLENQVQTIYIPINDFVPTFRGRTLQDMPSLKFIDVQQMGILVADKQVGDFRIDLIGLKLK